MTKTEAIRLARKKKATENLKKEECITFRPGLLYFIWDVYFKKILKKMSKKTRTSQNVRILGDERRITII